MRNVFRSRAVGAALMALALVATACGSGDDATTDDEAETTTTASASTTAADATTTTEAPATREAGPTIVVASFNFNESTILAEIYGQALESASFPVDYKLNLGNREVVKPALESGEISLVPEYVGTLLSFLEGTPSADSQATWGAAKAAFETSGVTLLDYAPAQDKNAYVVTQASADEYGLSKVSDLGPVAGDLVFGGPPECPDRDACLKGLEEVYGLTFAEFKPLDVAGPLTVAALESGDIDVALLFSTQGIIADRGFVVLDDDEGLNPAENIVPAIRQEVVDAYGDELVSLLNAISAKITTEELTAMNSRADIGAEDPAVIAEEWLAANGF